ncbi:MAG: TetR/AcrR family transcriptional regulator [Acidobacteria bacterium]|nr:TetR/AcrR family transcriptional regulator [Acidobacteriota bacterium]
MARPRSDAKRQAILDASVELFADRGIAHAPTSAISSAARVAEGTLFTYFKTKDELLNELYREMRKEIDQEMADFPFTGDVHARLRFVWDRFLDMAEKHPKRLKVQQHLRSSGRLLKDAEAPNMVIKELLRASKEGAELGGLGGVSPEYLVLMFRAQAEATAEFIAAHREMKAKSREIGFKLVWRALVGQ